MNDVWRGRLARWSKDLAFVLLALLAVRLYQTWSHPSGPAPRVEAVTLGGRAVTLGGESDAPTVLHFWATWCGVCQAEEGTVDALARDARVITIASRSGSDAEVARYLQAQALGFEVINDPDGTLAARYRVGAYPSTFFLDREGSIVTSEVGFTTGIGMRLRLWWAGL